MPKDDPNDPKPVPSNLFAILFDVDTAKAKGQDILKMVLQFTYAFSQQGNAITACNCLL